MTSHNLSSQTGDRVPTSERRCSGESPSTVPPSVAVPADDRRERARTLGSASRLAMLASFARGRDVAVTTSGRSYPELQGLQRFQRWLTESGRVADGAGSAWWSQVNGLLLLDMVESAALGQMDAVGCSEPVRAWAAYWTNHTKGERTRLCWEAHQCSLDQAARTAEGELALELPTERDFITMALSSVEIAAHANLPTGRGGSRVVGGFCRVFYPSSYPAGDEAGAEAQSLLTRATGSSHPGMRIVSAVIRGRFGR